MQPENTSNTESRDTRMPRTPRPVQALFDRARPRLARYLEDARIQSLADHLHERQQSCTPVIMVYGLFNAGKSTLINALVGDMVAEEGVVPTTAAIDRYRWGAYELLDTPGVDALADHEATTQAQLERSDLILFVINSASAVDDQHTYETVIQLVDEGRRVMLILNNTEGHLNDATCNAVNDEVRSLLQQKATESRIEIAQLLKHIPIHWVDARSARRGRMEDKPLLLRESRLPELEQALGRFIEETDKADLIERLAGDVRRIIDEALEVIQGQQSERGEAKFERIATRLDSETQRISVAMSELIRQQRQTLSSQLRQWMEDPEQVSETWIEQQLNSLVQELSSALEQRLEEELARTSQHLQAVVDELDPVSVVASAEASLEDVEFNTAGASSDEQKASSLLPPGTLQMLMKEIRSEHLVKAMQIAKDLLPKLFKGIGPKTMERWADKILKGTRLGGHPLVQVGVQLVTGLYQYYRAEQSRKEEAARFARYQEQVRDAARRIGYEYEASARSGIDVALRQALQPARDQLDEALGLAQEETQTLEADRQALTSLRNALAVR